MEAHAQSSLGLYPQQVQFRRSTTRQTTRNQRSREGFPLDRRLNSGLCAFPPPRLPERSRCISRYMEADMESSVVILAGGKSSRLGRDKSFLLMEGQPLVARLVQKLSVLSDDLIIVTNDATGYEKLALPARLVPDLRPGVGSLMGIYSGLTVARHPQALTVACDMPFLSLPLLRYMLSQADGVDVVIPRLGGLLEPLHAIYNKSCLAAMDRLLAQNRRQIIAFFPEVDVRYVEEEEVDRFDPHHLSFVNVNTLEDWELVQQLLKAGSSSFPGAA
jgi:molybdopterin-guanine dinucleotide biosynthesis protein A